MRYLLLPEGFEELEAIAPLDFLARADCAVTKIGLQTLHPKSSHGLQIQCDCLLEELLTRSESLSAVILPGGPGYTAMLESPLVETLLKKAVKETAILAAICAGPVVLGKYGYLRGKRACCAPGFEKLLTGATVLSDGVVQDEDIITARGAGDSLAFAYKLTQSLVGNTAAEAVAQKMRFSPARS